MVKTVAGRICFSRVEGTLLRSGAYAFMHWVLIELGKGIDCPFGDTAELWFSKLNRML
jgi:hypothetical protein